MSRKNLIKSKKESLMNKDKHRKEWSQVVKNVESKCTYKVTEDVERIKEAVEPNLLPYVINTLKLSMPRAPPPSYVTVPGIQSPEIVDETKCSLPKHSKEDDITVTDSEIFSENHAEEEQASIESQDEPRSESQTFRNTVCSTIYSRICNKPIISPYKIDLSEEESLKSEDQQERSLTDSLKDEFEKETDLIVHRTSHPPEKPVDVLDDNKSPYQKFFSRSKNEIENHLNRHVQKQVHSEKDKLFIDFINFLDLPDIKLKSENITLESLKALFDIQIENPAAHAFISDTAELSKIPKEISNIYEDIQASGRASLHRQIIWDMMYEKGKEKKVAFGRAVDKPRPAWNGDTRRKWLISDQIPWDLVSGRDLWKDLLNTEILEGFAKWLLANPQYDRPKYLEKIGYFKALSTDVAKEDPVQMSLKKKRCGEAFYTLANNMKYFVGDNELSYLPRLEELKEVLEYSTQVPGDVD